MIGIHYYVRHDWNSLLCDYHNNKLLLGNYTKEYLPNADYYIQYLNDYNKILL